MWPTSRGTLFTLICQTGALLLNKRMPMSWMTLTLTVLTVTGLSIGQVLFKMAANQMQQKESLWRLMAANSYLWWALLVYGVSTVLWIAVLREVPLRLAYPFVGSAFFIVPLLGHFFLNESLHWQSIVGGIFIIIGIAVATMGDFR